MRTRKHLHWAALVAVPLVLVAALWMVEQRRQQRMAVQEATRMLQAQIEQDNIRPALIRQLIERGADINVRARDRSTLLHHLPYASLGFSDANIGFSGQLPREQVALARLLIAHGANVNACDKYGTTALMIAANCTNLEMLQFLLDHGAQVNLRRREGPITENALSIARRGLKFVKDFYNGARMIRGNLTAQDTRIFTYHINRANRIITMLTAAGARE